MSPGSIDPQVVRRHLLALDTALQQLRRHVGKPPEAFADLDLAWAVQHGLLLCAQNVLDIATHLAAAAGRDVPDYASAIDRLAELTILPRPFARSFRAVAGFRNILVHGYLEVDLQQVQRLLDERLEDFVTFVAHVQAHLEKATGRP